MPPKRKAAAKASPAKAKQARITDFVPGAKASGKASGGGKVKETGPLDLAAHLTETSWREALKEELAKPYFQDLQTFLAKEYAAGKEVFPPRSEIFAAFNAVPLSKVRSVILGQDPYHDVGQAHGLCFSVRRGVKPPPSLKNVFKELASDVGLPTPTHGCLDAWARQGVFLPNATLTVQAHKANSHAKAGWQQLTDAAIAAVSAHSPHAVFILWGGFAQKKASLIDTARHTVLKSAHPSPLSVTKFLGSKPFSKTNAALKGYGLEEIDWSLK